MKTICTKIDNKSIQLFNDEFEIEERDDTLFIFDDNRNLIFAISTPSLYFVYDNVPGPENWTPNKYRYIPGTGWCPSKDWTFPYEVVFDNLYNKHQQLIQCLYDKSVIDDENLLLLSETRTLEESIERYKKS
jgi:hypothetical protein